MVSYGVTTVIDLRTASELEGTPSDSPFPWAATDAERPDGVRWLHLPLVEDVQRKIDNATTGIGRYIEIVNTRQPAFGTVFNAIAEANGPLLFHCFAGKDRTGIVAAMLLELAGVSREHIAADYGETDRQLARQYEIWLGDAAPDKREMIREDLCCPADRILGVLDHIDRRWGGVAGYLEAAGMPAVNLDRVGSLLV